MPFHGLGLTLSAISFSWTLRWLIAWARQWRIADWCCFANRFDLWGVFSGHSRLPFLSLSHCEFVYIHHEGIHESIFFIGWLPIQHQRSRQLDVWYTCWRRSFQSHLFFVGLLACRPTRSYMQHPHQSTVFWELEDLTGWAGWPA